MLAVKSVIATEQRGDAVLEYLVEIELVRQWELGIKACCDWVVLV